MSSTLLDLGIIKIKWYSFFILLAFLIAYYIIQKEAKKKNIDKEKLYDLLFYGMIISIIGARLYYVLFNLNYYLIDKIEIIKIWNGGLAIHGGIITGVIFTYFFCKRKKINFELTLDILVVGLIIAQAIGRWGNFFNQEAYGRIISLSYLKSIHLPEFIINGMYINGYYREPTFLYESLASILGFIILIIIRKNKKLKVLQLTGIYLVWYSTERIIIEALRTDSLMLYNMKMAQIISIIGIILGIYLVFKNIKNNRLYKDETYK